MSNMRLKVQVHKEGSMLSKKQNIRSKNKTLRQWGFKIEVRMSHVRASTKQTADDVSYRKC